MRLSIRTIRGGVALRDFLNASFEYLDPTTGPLCETAWAFNGVSAAKKPPARAGGFGQFAKKVLIALP